MLFQQHVFRMFSDPSSVFHSETPYGILFPPSKSLFPIEPRIFGSACVVRDVCPHDTKLDPKSFGYSHRQKGYRCYVMVLVQISILSPLKFTFLEETPHFPSFTTTCRGKDKNDDLLIYILSHLLNPSWHQPLPSLLFFRSTPDDSPFLVHVPHQLLRHPMRLE